MIPQYRLEKALIISLMFLIIYLLIMNAVINYYVPCPKPELVMARDYEKACRARGSDFVYINHFEGIVCSEGVISWAAMDAMRYLPEIYHNASQWTIINRSKQDPNLKGFSMVFIPSDSEDIIRSQQLPNFNGKSQAKQSSTESNASGNRKDIADGKKGVDSKDVTSTS